MKRIIMLLSIWLVGAGISFAGQGSGLASARQAQVLLGSEVWSQVIRIENTGSTVRHPRVVHALVFELAGILWYRQPQVAGLKQRPREEAMGTGGWMGAMLPG